MLRIPFRFAMLLTLMFCLLPGCSYFQGDSDGEADDEFAEFDEEESKDDESELDPDADSTSEQSLADRPAEGELQLKLKVGDRFPLKKRIEQRLTQGDGVGGTLVNRSIVEMMLSLVVEEVRDGNSRLGVRYHKVHYAHNIAGRKVEYNSDWNEAPAAEALVYAGLKDNGFSFWIGPDNRVTELVGFPEFLQRCAEKAPPAYREAVLKQLEGTATEEGLANFVDDGIGLLPYSNDPQHPAVAVRVGSTWELRPRRIEGPIPTQVSTRCILKNLTDTTAEIGMIGNIDGSSTAVAARDSKELRVQVKGGHCSGFCMVDRQTGLPTQSEVTRFLEMTVQLPGGKEIPQRKEILTTTTSFLDQGGGSSLSVSDTGSFNRPATLGSASQGGSFGGSSLSSGSAGGSSFSSAASGGSGFSNVQPASGTSFDSRNSNASRGPGLLDRSGTR